jgi:hypothetical protein
MLLALTSTPIGDCGLARKLDSGGSLVRARRYTVDKPSGCESDAEMCSASSLDPQCGSSAAECVEDDSCNAGGDGIDVRYNSRTYVLADDASASRSLGGSLKDMLAGAPAADADHEAAPAPVPQEPGDLEC